MGWLAETPQIDSVSHLGPMGPQYPAVGGMKGCYGSGEYNIEILVKSLNKIKHKGLDLDHILL